jgi:alpha-beta hydrolase superfamily lysophospholipase
MGSYIAQSFVMRGLGRPDGLILSGSTLAPLLQLRMGHWLAAWEQFRRDPAANSKRLNDLGIGALNRRFEPARTPSDWLSRDEAEVDKYVNDPHCGADSSIGLWHQLTAGLLEISSARAMKKVDSDLPILITGGASDPVGGRKGMTRLAQGYRNTGHRNVTLKIYDGGRHEMLNEINRDEFMHDLRTWLLDNVPIRSE